MTIRNATLAVLAAAAIAAPSAWAEEKPKAVVNGNGAWRPRPSEGRAGFAFGLEWEFPFAGMSGFLNPTLENPFNGQPLHLDLDLGVRFYPFAPAPRVFFIGPYLGGGYINGGIPSGQLGVQAEARVGVLLGLSLLLADWVFGSVAVGGEYYNIQNIYRDGTIEQSTENLGTVVRAAIGFAF
ncbi:MAG TPA: hypothetical protein VFB81_08100 [Myxococcales bacterium]|nr:hypothetical protein [Myxococcales bacterium]